MNQMSAQQLQAQAMQRLTTQEEQRVLSWAVEWWVRRRHPGDSEAEQIEQDTAFTGWLRDSDKGLARAVALYVRGRNEKLAAHIGEGK